MTRLRGILAGAILPVLSIPMAMAAVSGPAGATKAWADPGAVPGAYVGTTQGAYDLTFRVRDNKVRSFSTAVVVYCTDFSGTQPLVKSVTLPTFPLRRDGSFAFSKKTTSGSSTLTVTVTGDIDRGRLTRGRVVYKNKGDGFECLTDGPQPLAARRR